MVLSVAGDQFVEAARIMSILWEGATTAGDRATVVDRVTNALLFPFRTDGSHTFLGISFGPHGMPAPNGFKLQQISAGRVCVFLRES